MTGETRKRGLGRGLDALFKEVKSEEESFQPKVRRADEMVAAAQQLIETKSAPKGAGENNGPQRRLPVEKLTPGKFQPRRTFNEESIDALAESISAHGVLQPLLVRPLPGGMFEIIAGERRWRAAQKAQVHEVPVVVREMGDMQALEIALIENLQREDLNAIEEADGYQRLMEEFGHTQEILAQNLGKSRSHISNTLRLLKLPRNVRRGISMGQLSAGHARALLGAAHPEEIAGIVISKGLNVRQTEALVRKYNPAKARAKKIADAIVAKDVDIAALEDKIMRFLGLRVEIEQAATDGPQAGRLILIYKTLDQLDDLVLRLSVPPQK